MTHTTPASAAAGWARPDGCELAHYFAGPRSLCRAATLSGGEVMTPGAPGECCRECREVFDGWFKAKEGS